jgi:hypothetical protein
MVKFRKYKFSWAASDSKNVVGYKVYWSKGTEVSYDSEYIGLINLTEIILPDDVPFLDIPIMFGVTAIDRDGNESDITTLPEPFQVQVPKAPVRLTLEPLDEFEVLISKKVVGTSFERKNINDPLTDAIEHHWNSQTEKMKGYDGVGYPRR